jgi:peptidoglycan/LPS O-acetylase OafA/YrhL
LNHDVIHTAGRFSTAWFYSNGRIGVDIFFALSGILICSRLLEEEQRTGTLNLKNFYLRRLFRIQPAAWAYLLAIFLLMFFGVLGHGYGSIADSLLLVRNYLPLKPAEPDWYTGHFWSLSVEEHFYLLLPGFLLLFRKNRGKLLAGFVAILLCWQTLQRHYSSLYFGWQLSAHTGVAINGILLASAFAVHLQSPRVRAWCIRWVQPWLALSITLALLGVLQFFDHPLLNLPVYCAYALLVVSTMLHPDTVLGRFLELRWVRYLGRISYSIYLWQMLFFARGHGISLPHSTLLAMIQSSTPLRYAATLLASVASYYLIERPFVRLGHRMTPRTATPHSARDEHRPGYTGIVAG